MSGRLGNIADFRALAELLAGQASHLEKATNETGARYGFFLFSTCCGKTLIVIPAHVASWTSQQ